MNSTVKTVLTIAGAVAVGFLVHKLISKAMGTASVDEEFAMASGIQCSCRRADGSYTYKTCRTAGTSANCEQCCGHYGFKHEGFGY